MMTKLKELREARQACDEAQARAHEARVRLRAAREALLADETALAGLTLAVFVRASMEEGETDDYETAPTEPTLRVDAHLDGDAGRLCELIDMLESSSLSVSRGGADFAIYSDGDHVFVEPYTESEDALVTIEQLRRFGLPLELRVEDARWRLQRGLSMLQRLEEAAVRP